MKVSIKSNAKINIGLNILEKLSNGYHSLEMVMVPISLADDIEIEFTKERGELIITTNIVTIPTDKKNILWKIYDAFYKVTGKEKERIEVYLKKNIPHEAGLGGGSSNGAFFLKELNKYYNNILTEDQLIEIGGSIGADIPFFIKNCPAVVRGIGEKLEKIENNLSCDVILVKPNFGVSTGQAYGFYSIIKESGIIKNADINEIVKGLNNNDRLKIENNSENILEQGLLLCDDNIKKFRKYLESNFDKKFFMSGSGSCYYTFCSKGHGKKYAEILRKQLINCQIYICSFL